MNDQMLEQAMLACLKGIRKHHEMLLNQGRSQAALTKTVIDSDEKLREAYAQNLTVEFQTPNAESVAQMLEAIDATILLLEQGKTPDALDS